MSSKPELAKLAGVKVQTTDDLVEIACPVPGSDAVATFTFSWRDDAWSIVKVAAEGDTAITSYTLRRLPMEVAQLAFRQTVLPFLHQLPSGEWAYSMARAGTFAAPDFRDGRRRGSRWTDVELARLAADYAMFVERGDPHPTQSLHESRHLGKGRLRALLSSARTGGLLTKTKPGHSGGRLTVKAQKLLASADA